MSLTPGLTSASDEHYNSALWSEAEEASKRSALRAAPGLGPVERFLHGRTARSCTNDVRETGQHAAIAGGDQLGAAHVGDLVALKVELHELGQHAFALKWRRGWSKCAKVGPPRGGSKSAKVGSRPYPKDPPVAHVLPSQKPDASDGYRGGFLALGGLQVGLQNGL